MMQTLNPSSSSSKTDEIMSRYRPIAPKPTEIPNSGSDVNNGGLVVPEKFRQSPYLRNMWSHLQARPTRTRKRAARSSASSIFRNHQHQKGFRGFDNSINNNNTNIVTLPLVERKLMDLNTTTTSVDAPVLEERDFLLQLQVPNSGAVVISPRPVRPVGSTITVVGAVIDEASEALVRTAEEVEEAVEGEAFPVVISDRNNKVRMANWAYKELVGQPECQWLDMTSSSSGTRKRIGGEVMINVPMNHPEMGNGFSCLVKIEWEREGKKSGVNAFCNVVKFVCNSSSSSKDYMFSWRFHTREVSPSGSNVVGSGRFST